MYTIYIVYYRPSDDENPNKEEKTVSSNEENIVSSYENKRKNLIPETLQNLNDNLEDSKNQFQRTIIFDLWIFEKRES